MRALVVPFALILTACPTPDPGGSAGTTSGPGPDPESGGGTPTSGSIGPSAAASSSTPPPDAGSEDEDDGGSSSSSGPPPEPLDPIPPPEAEYHTFEEVEGYLELWAERRPERVALESYGTSTEGRPLYMVRVSDNVDDDEGEPRLLLNFSIHGDEIITVECALALLDKLIERADDDPRVSAIIESTMIHVVPVMSPDSFAARTRIVDGVDPNREWPDGNDPDRPSIPIIMAARDMYESHDFVGTLDVHGGGSVVLMPYGASWDDPPNLDELTDVGTQMADAVPAHLGPFDVAKIPDWLEPPRLVYGGSLDYYHWRTGLIHLGLEMVEYQPPLPELREHTDVFVEMGLRFLENATG